MQDFRLKVLFFSLGSSSLLLKCVHALLQGDSFKISTPAAKTTLKIAENLAVWVPANLTRVEVFQREILNCFRNCFQSTAKTPKARREKMWTTYHTVRTSNSYREIWASLLKQISAQSAPILCQYLGNLMFKELIVLHYPQQDPSTPSSSCSTLTSEEIYGL